MGSMASNIKVLNGKFEQLHVNKRTIHVQALFYFVYSFVSSVTKTKKDIIRNKHIFERTNKFIPVGKLFVYPTLLNVDELHLVEGAKFFFFQLFLFQTSLK